jgi:hypothetical protein
VPVCRLRKAAGSNTKLFFDGVLMSMPAGIDATARPDASVVGLPWSSECRTAAAELRTRLLRRSPGIVLFSIAEPATSLLSMVNFRARLAGQTSDLRGKVSWNKTIETISVLSS